MPLKKTLLTIIFFLSLILISFGVKLIEFDNPFSGFHQKRQMDNLATIENYFIEGIELKRRAVDGGYVLYELPIYQTLAAVLSSSRDDILPVARIVNLVFALLSMILLFKIASTWFDVKTAIYSTLYFAFAPLNLMYHRSVMMDISSVFFCLAATWLLIAYFESGKKLWHALLFMIAGGLVVTTKPLYFFPVGAIALANYISQYQPPFSSNTINYLKKNLKLVVSFTLITTTMIGWLEFGKSINGPGVELLNNMINWDFLISPGFYALLVFRTFFLMLNPFTSILFMIGIILIWTRYRKKDAIALLFFIPLYFLFFGQAS